MIDNPTAAVALHLNKTQRTTRTLPPTAPTIVDGTAEEVQEQPGKRHRFRAPPRAKTQRRANEKDGLIRCHSYCSILRHP